MILVLILIENLIIFRFMALKSKFDVKRNLPIKLFGYSRGKHRSNKELSRCIVEIASYCKIKRRYSKTVLLRLKHRRMRRFKFPIYILLCDKAEQTCIYLHISLNSLYFETSHREHPQSFPSIIMNYKITGKG